MSASNVPQSQAGAIRAPSGPLALQMQVQVPQIVFNGFAVAHSASEINGLLSFGERPVVSLAIPLSVAKSFAQALMNSIEHYERSTGTAVKSIEELEASISQFEASQTP